MFSSRCRYYLLTQSCQAVPFRQRVEGVEGAWHGRCASSEAQGDGQGSSGHAPRQDAQGVRQPFPCTRHQVATQRRLGPLVGVQRDGRCIGWRAFCGDARDPFRQLGEYVLLLTQTRSCSRRSSKQRKRPTRLRERAPRKMERRPRKRLRKSPRPRPRRTPRPRKRHKGTPVTSHTHSNRLRVVEMHRLALRIIASLVIIVIFMVVLLAVVRRLP